MRDWYIASFRDLRSFKPLKDQQDEAKFTDLLRDIYDRHKWDPHLPILASRCCLLPS